MTCIHEQINPLRFVMLVFLVVVDGKDKCPLSVDAKVRRPTDAAGLFVSCPAPSQALLKESEPYHALCLYRSCWLAHDTCRRCGNKESWSSLSD